MSEIERESVAARVGTAIARVLALAFGVAFFVGLPVGAVLAEEWTALVLWTVLVVLMWIANSVAPSEF